jgi:hypothetical protein
VVKAIIRIKTNLTIISLSIKRGIKMSAQNLRMPSFTFAIAMSLVAFSGLSNAAPPAGLPDAAPPFGLPDSAPPFGKGVGRGKGKGASVAAVSYHCLGVGKQLKNQASPYSYLADSIVVDAGAQQATLEGAATGDLVVNDIATVPTHMAGASISTAGLSLQSFDVCGTSAQSALNSVVIGFDAANPGATGVAYAEVRFNYHARLETQNDKGSAGSFSAFTQTTLNVLGLQEESFTVSATGELVEAPPGLSVVDLSNGGHFVYEISGTYVVPVQLFYGAGIKNVVLTTFEAAGVVSSVDVTGSKVVAGFASAEALKTLTYEIVSLDPNVSFSFVPAE